MATPNDRATTVNAEPLVQSDGTLNDRVTTVNAEALVAVPAGGNDRATTVNAEPLVQQALAYTNLRATTVNAEVLMQGAPPVRPVDFEMQTPSREMDPGQTVMVKRIYIDADLAGQTLTPTLLADGTDIELPAITNTQRGVIEIPWQQKAHLLGLRLTGELYARVEIFGISMDIPVGREPGQ